MEGGAAETFWQRLFEKYKGDRTVIGEKIQRRILSLELFPPSHQGFSWLHIFLLLTEIDPGKSFTL